ncbi:MAG: arylamine N-acetyltransferase [Gammaproteobacteria bacterium]|nr:arylamine N-acetyltransferase [Gammaproteobacteria bacterium]
MRLDEYFGRIGFEGPVQPDLECLTALHQQHLLSIPYENLDVQLQRPVDLDGQRIFDKIVLQQRGGWCYEMNGLLEWALVEIGFDVMRMNGGVMRAEWGDDALGNHLVLCVNLDEPYVADVGLGDGLFEPVPLRADTFTQGAMEYQLELLDDGLWRFHNHSGRSPPSFDFNHAPADEELFAQRCSELQSEPDSMFVQNLICQRIATDGTYMLLGRVLSHLVGDEVNRTLLMSPEQLQATLLDVFGLDMPEAAELWPRVVERHNALFGDTNVDEIRFGPPSS